MAQPGQHVSVHNIDPKEWRLYVEWLLAPLREPDAKFFTLTHKQEHKTFKNSNLEVTAEKMVLRNGSERADTRRRKRDSDGNVKTLDERLDIKTFHALCSLELPRFRELLVDLIGRLKKGDKIAQATTVAAQYARDLLISLAMAATCRPQPYPPLQALGLLHMYKFLCEPGDNVYAAAISEHVTELRELLLDDAARDRILQLASNRVLFTSKSYEKVYRIKKAA